MIQKFDFNDITIVPEAVSSIDSRKEIDIHIDDMLPLITAPMDSVVDSNSYSEYLNRKIIPCLPRFCYPDSDDVIISGGLNDSIELIEKHQPKKFLIDIANGHMKKMHDLADYIKKNYNIKLMVGNIANPRTYNILADIGVDSCRVGIGGGQACTTSANVAIHYPMGSLLSEIYDIKKTNGYNMEIIADGGIKNSSDIIKALMLGADYVMMGNIFARSCESGGKFFHDEFDVTRNEVMRNYKEYEYQKLYRGMSTKAVQKDWGNKNLKTSEGISFMVPIEYSLDTWVENFTDYLRSAMSYTDSRNLSEFRESEYVFITDNAFKRFNK